MKISFAILMFLLSSDTLIASIKKINEAAIDETEYILRELPNHLVPVNDSMLYFTSDDNFVLSNYRTGEVKKVYSIKKFMNTSYLASHFLNIDTLGNAFTEVKKRWEEMGLREVQIEAITKFDDRNILLIVDVNFPKLISISGDDSVFSAEKLPFYLILNSQTLAIQKINSLDLKWEPSKRHFEAAIFGLSVFNNTIYVGKCAFPDYDGNIFSAFNKQDFSRLNTSINIYHKPYENAPSPQTVSFFKIYKFEDAAFVCNRSEVYDLASQTLLFDLSKYISNIQNVSLVVPVDKKQQRFFIYYSSVYDTTLKKSLKYTAYFDNSKDIVTERKPAYTSTFCEYGRKIISIEKREENYFYVVYTVD